MFTTTAYNTLGEAQEKETLTDSWAATEMCLDLSMLYGYAEATDPCNTHMGEYGDRPAALGDRAY